MKKGEVKIKGNMDLNAVTSILDDLLTSFKEGTVCIENGPEFITLKPSDLIEIEVEAAKKKGKEKLVIEMSWKQVLPITEMETGFKISCKEPDPVEPEEEDSEDDDCKETETEASDDDATPEKQETPIIVNVE